MQTQYGRYQIIRELGRGGMGTVYIAHDPQIGRDVALKVLPPAFTQDPSFRERFHREARVIAQLEHAAIVPVHDFGEDHGSPFFVMRLMKGGDLKERLEDGPLPPDQVAAITGRICSALDRAHANQIIHRDIKPGNILFDQDGAAYLADFGIARLAEATQTVTMIGTPQYMAPEQAQGLPLTASTDVYQMGVVVFEMLTGKLPFDAPTPASLLYHHAHTPIPSARSINGQLPPASEAVVQRAMAKDPGQRYQSAGALAAGVSRLAGAGSAAGVPPITAAYRPPAATPPRPKRTPADRGVLGWLRIIGGIAAVLVVGALLLERLGAGDPSEIPATPTAEDTLRPSNTPPLGPTATTTSEPTSTLSATSTVAPTKTQAAATEAPVVVVPTATPEPDFEGGVLVFSSRLFSPPREQEFLINEIIKPFEQEHGVTVNFQILDDDTLLERAVIQRESGHVTTDIVCAHNSRMPDWIDAGYVEDLTEAVAGWTDRHFSPAFVSDTNRDGRQFFLPVGADVYLTLANNNALPYLPDGADLDALTWEEYAQWAVNVAEGEGEGKVCITGIPMKSWIYMFGGTALSYGAGFPDANSEGAAAAWGIWETIGQANGFVHTVLNIDSCTDPMMREESWLAVFHNARAGQVYASNETQFTLAPAPSGPAGIGSVAGVSGYAIMKGTANYDLAVAFLEYLTRPDIQVKIAKGTGGFIPPVKEALEFVGTEAIDEVISKAVLVLENGAVSGVPATLYQDWGAVKQCFDDVFEDTILPGRAVDQARMDAAQACLDSLLK